MLTGYNGMYMKYVLHVGEIFATSLVLLSYIKIASFCFEFHQHHILQLTV